MPTTTIVEGDSPIVLINVFTVSPDRQDELVAVLTEATDSVMRYVDGFVSANVHASTDGTHVTNYAQWRDTAAYAAVLADPVAREHMGQAAQIAESFEPHLYTVRSVHHA